MAAKHAEFDNLIDRGIDINKRRIYFGCWGDLLGEEEVAGEFTIASVERAVRHLHRLIDINPKKPIELHMMSGGGDEHAMFRLIDEILACPCQVKFIGGGYIGSAATWVMAICDERWLHANTTVMAHDGSGGFDQSHTDNQIWAKMAKATQEKLNELFAANSRMPKSFWTSIIQRDVNLTAEEAITLGLADKIIPYKKRGNLRRMRQAHMSEKINKRKLTTLVKKIHARIERPTELKEIVINMPEAEPSDPNIIIDETTVDNIDTAKKEATSNEEVVAKDEGSVE